MEKRTFCFFSIYISNCHNFVIQSRTRHDVPFRGNFGMRGIRFRERGGARPTDKSE